MKKYLKLIAALLAVIGVVMMFCTQVTIVTSSNHKIALGLKALTGGSFNDMTCFSLGSGLAGYILLGVAALLLIVVSLVPFFKEHDILSAVVTGLSVICLIIGVVLIFLIRKNFMETNGYNSKEILVGWGAITAGSCGSIAALFGGLATILDLGGNN